MFPSENCEMFPSESQPQTITRCAAGRGWLWWVEAFRLMKEAAKEWFLIGLISLFSLFPLSALVGFIGLIIWLIIKATIGTVDDRLFLFFLYSLLLIAEPFFIVGLAAIGWSQIRLKEPEYLLLFSGFKADIKSLLGVGAMKVVLLWVFLFGGAVVWMAVLWTFRFILALPDPAGLLRHALFFVILAPAALMWMATWLASMEVVSRRVGVVGAIGSGFKAALVNWQALLVWALVGMVVLMVSGLLSSIPEAVLGTNGLADVVSLTLSVLITPFLIVLGGLTAFVAYGDIFHAKDAVFPRPVKSAGL